MNEQNKTTDSVQSTGLAGAAGSELIERLREESATFPTVYDADRRARALMSAAANELVRYCDQYTALADSAAQEIHRLHDVLELCHRTMKQAQRELESGGARYTWLDSPIDIAAEFLPPNNGDVERGGLKTP